MNAMITTQLQELFGAEIQQAPVKYRGKTVQLYFRQISDSEGKAIFGPQGPQDMETRSRTLVAKSLCLEDGTPALTPEEAQTLPLWKITPIFEAAAVVNGLINPDEPAASEDEPEKKDDAGGAVAAAGKGTQGAGSADGVAPAAAQPADDVSGTAGLVPGVSAESV